MPIKPELPPSVPVWRFSNYMTMSSEKGYGTNQGDHAKFPALLQNGL
jgi:hypothetical protein